MYDVQPFIPRQPVTIFTAGKEHEIFHKTLPKKSRKIKGSNYANNKHQNKLQPKMTKI